MSNDIGRGNRANFYYVPDEIEIACPNCGGRNTAAVVSLIIHIPPGWESKLSKKLLRSKRVVLTGIDATQTRFYCLDCEREIPNG